MLKNRFLLTLFSLFIAPLAFSQVQAADFAGDSIGKIETVRVEGKETLSDIAERYKIGYANLLAANPGVDPWLPGAGREIILPNWHILPDAPHEGIVLNTGELRLYYFPPDGSAPTSFPIGIGREGLTTPQGTTSIIRKVDGPSWSPTPRMRLEDPKLPVTVPPGPDNPLGVRAMYLGWQSYRIHGTNHEKAIGRRASSGCIRMYKPEIIWLYDHTPVGTKVTSVDEPIKMGWIDGNLYLEAEPNDLQIDELEYKNRQISIDIPDGVIERIRKKAGDKVSQVDWEKVRSVLVYRTGLPVRITGTGTPAAPEAVPVAPVAKEKTTVKTTTTTTTTTSSTTTVNPHKQAAHDWDNLNSH